MEMPATRAHRRSERVKRSQHPKQAGNGLPALD
jgi:hypothetical protein